MSPKDRTVFACSCEGTMPLDREALAKGCNGALATADQLCRRELDRVREALAQGGPVTIGCTQEAAAFRDLAEEAGRPDALALANVREAAGWSDEARDAGPKMAALLAAAAEAMPPVETVSLESEGVALVYGRDEAAIEIARRLADHLDVTVLVTRPREVAVPRATEFPVVQGTIRRAQGVLGAFSLGIDDYAIPSPASRRHLAFGPSRNGATSTCDIVIDVSGSAPLFPAHEVRPGYLRADPGDRAALERLVFEASHLVGTFDKPRFVAFDEGLCAHSRSRITGCTRCLDLCPTGAIAPAGEHVAIDPLICAGCGSCAAACPTGAAAYALPPVDALARRLRTLMGAYRTAGGRSGVVLFHDEAHGAPLIDALARFGDGLPATVMPVAVNEVTQIGPETIAALFAYGATGVRILSRARPKHDLSGLQRTLSLCNTILAELGYGAGVATLIETDDPDALRAALDRATAGIASPSPAAFLPMGPKRGVLEASMRALHAAAPAPVDVVALAAGAPFGGLDIDVDGCTLCLSCVSACPTNALSDNPERPQLRFTESQCVQCGLCAATCPERVITLKPQLDFAAWNNPKRVVKEEEPFHCVRCAKPFGVRSTVERVSAKLADRHWMFSGAAGQARLEVLRMCDDCRVDAVLAESFDPHAMPPRPLPRTAEDDRREAEGVS